MKKIDALFVISLITVVIAVGLLSFTAVMGPLSQENSNSNQWINPFTTSEGSGGGYASYADIFGITMFKTTFLASWLYDDSNGSLVYHYSPYWSYSQVQWDIVAWISLKNPEWKQNSENQWMAFGDGQYHIGLYYFSITQCFYSKVSVPPNSYGGSTFNAGYGSVS